MEKIRQKKIILLIIYLIPMAILLYQYVVNDFSVDQLLAYKYQYNTLKDAHIILFSVLFLLTYSALIATSISFNVIMNLFAGYLFGPFTGALCATIAITSGSFILFLLARSSTVKVSRKLEKIHFLKTEQKNVILTLFFMRLSPVIPAPLITIASGIYSLKSHVFLMTTFLGSLPLVFAYTVIGNHLESIDHISEIYDQPLIVSLLLLTIISLGPLLKQDVRDMMKLSGNQSPWPNPD